MERANGPDRLPRRGLCLSGGVRHRRGSVVDPYPCSQQHQGRASRRVNTPSAGRPGGGRGMVALARAATACFSTANSRLDLADVFCPDRDLVVELPGGLIPARGMATEHYAWRIASSAASLYSCPSVGRLKHISSKR